MKHHDGGIFPSQFNLEDFDAVREQDKFVQISDVV
jgi:hypothetical protein